MKITPVAQGSPMPNLAEATRSPDKIARAKAIAAGEAPLETSPLSGDPQVDKINARRIKMKTQMSTNRDDVQEPLEAAPEAIETETPISDTTEQASETEETRPLSPQFAALAKAKRALQIERAEVAKMKAEVEATRGQSSFDPEKYVSIEELTANPTRIFDLGVSYDKMTEAILNGSSNPISSKDIDALVEKKLNERLEKEFGSRDSAAEQQVLSEIRRDAISLTSEGEEFEAIREAKANGYNPHTDIVNLVHTVYKKGWPEKGLEAGHVMSTKEAASYVEDQLIEEAVPWARMKKVQSRLTPAQEQMIAQTPIAQKPNTKIMRTLTNRDNASPVMDKRARAIAAMNGTLKRG